MTVGQIARRIWGDMINYGVLGGSVIFDHGEFNMQSEQGACFNYTHPASLVNLIEAEFNSPSQARRVVN